MGPQRRVIIYDTPCFKSPYFHENIYFYKNVYAHVKSCVVTGCSWKKLGTYIPSYFSPLADIVKNVELFFEESITRG